MSFPTPRFFTYPGAGAEWSDALGYSQAVLVNGTALLSGQGGWTPAGSVEGLSAEQQVKNVFNNVETALAAAGIDGGWAAVYRLRSYHVGMAKTLEFVSAEMKTRAPQRPVWTAVAVPELATPAMVIEIEVEAWAGK
ncbi:hypothetical protein JCM10207_002747 [Rhodosporidiobolus poonsookiae]